MADIKTTTIKVSEAEAIDISIAYIEESIKDKRFEIRDKEYRIKELEKEIDQLKVKKRKVSG
jgi:hypothetical protein